MSKKSMSIAISIMEESFMPTAVTVPAQVYELLYNYFKVSLKVGTYERDVKCFKNDTKNILGITNDLAEKLGLSDGMTINIKVHNNNICLWPVIGVFTSAGQVRKANLQEPLFRLTELVKANKEANTILYFFSIKDVDFTQQRIYGTYYNHKTCRWEQKYFPYPDVLYDRGGGVLRSQRKISDKIRQQLQTNENMRNINPLYSFDKWDVFTQLVKHEEMRHYLPHTVLYETPNDLHTMLNSYSAIYIKECLMNNGHGVFRVKKLSLGMFELSYCSHELYTEIYHSFNTLVKNLNALLSDNKIILQAEIDVMKIDDSNVDLRALVQRNGKGQMEIGVFPVRIGRVGYPITNTRTGASVYRFGDFLNDYFQDEESKDQVAKRIIDFLSTSFRLIEDAYGTFGEIGIDFALDKNLNVWFIECNAKPGKDALYSAYDEKIVKRAFLNPLEYGKHLIFL